jgi:hypothetical protein
VTGNGAVHASELDLRDDRATAASHFVWVSLIAERMISEPARLEAACGVLPEAKRKHIEERDARTQGLNRRLP